MLDQAEAEFLSNEQNQNRYESTYYQANSHLSSEGQPYFKFTKEYITFLSTKYAQLMEYSAIKNFIENMNEVNKKAYYLSIEMVNLLDQKYKGISKNFYDKQEELYVVTKIIRYKRVEGKIDMRAEAHYDRSAFTILWDSSDNKYDKLVVAENVKNKYLGNLVSPKRLHARSNNSTSALIISGAACKFMTSDIKPLLHAVLPFNQDYRYAVVSFLVPYINYQMPEVKIPQNN